MYCQNGQNTYTCTVTVDKFDILNEAKEFEQETIAHKNFTA